MSLEFKPDFERARTYWEAFWNHAIIDRPCTLVRADKGVRPIGFARLQPVEGDFEKAVREYDGYLETHAFLGEFMPSFRPGFGPDQMAGFLGAPLLMSPDGRTSWSEKVVDSWGSFLPLKIDESNLAWKRMKVFHRVAERHFRGRCLLQDIDMHSNIDTLEGLRGAQDLIFDMIDTPDIILEAMRQARRIYFQVYDQFHRYGEKKKWGTTCQLPFYSKGKYNRIQADLIGLLNPELFRRFVLEAIEEEALALDRSCFHLDGPGALNHLDDILHIRAIDAVQWVPGAGNKIQLDWPEVLHRIQAAGKAIILHLAPEQVRSVHGEYNPEQLVYDVKAASEEEGLALLAWLKGNT